MKPSGRLRPIAGSIVRGAMNLLSRAGLSNRLIRNSEYSVVGVEWRWANDEAFVTRGLVVDQTINSVPVSFFVTDENDYIQQHHMWGQWYEHGELRIMAEHFSGGTFVDVGANVGNHTLYAGLVMKASKVIAFEPNPPAFDVCRYNILLNGLAGKAEVRNVGLSDVSEQAKIKSSPDRNLGGTSLAVGNGNLRLVQGDEVLEGETPSFIKIDVETLEMKVLSGLRDTLTRCQPTLFVEVDAANDAEFKTFIKSVNYAIVHALPMTTNTNYLCRPKDQ